MSRKSIEVSSQYTTKDGQKKWRNTTVGSAFVYDGGNISLQLDPGIALVGGVEGVRITLKEPFVRGEQRQAAPRAPAQTAMPTDGGDLPDWMK